MAYYLNKTVNCSFEAAIADVQESLKNEGFRILSDIDVQRELRDKLHVTFRRYRILGACNPQFAHKALLTEDKIGTMLPSNVIVQEDDHGQVEVSAVNPIASMQAIENVALKDLAGQVRHKLERVIQAL